MGGLLLLKIKIMSYKNLSLKPIYKEKWYDIYGFENLYQISSFGRVMALDRITGTKSYARRRKNLILKQAIDKDGYCKVGLSKNGIQKTFSVHRLLLISVYGYKKGKPYVNHKNGIKNCNHIENLEWCTQSENKKHAFATGLQKSMVGLESASAKKIVQYNMDNSLIKEWDSIMDVERGLGFKNSAISRCCLGGRPTAYGFKWKHKQIA